MLLFRSFVVIACAALGGLARLAAQAPANDNFAAASAITTFSSQFTQTNAGATKETGEPNHAGATGGHSVWWKFTATTSGFYSLNTTGSAIDTVLAVYVGTAVNALTEVARNDEWATGGLTSSLSFYGNAGTTYVIAVDGVAGTTGTVKLTINFQGAANLYATDFEAFTLGAGQLAGHDGWLTNSTVAGTSGIYQVNAGGSKGAFLGANATAEPFVTIYHPTTLDAVAAGAPRIRLDVDMLIADSTNGHGDRFAFDLFNTQNQFLCELQFDTRNHTVYSHDGTTLWTSGSFAPGVGTHLTVTYDLQANSWSATLDGKLLTLPLSLNTTGTARTLGYIDAIWMVTTPGAAGNNSLGLDSFRVSALIGAPSLTTQPASRTIAAGSSTTFTVAATPTVALAYQWRKNGVDLAGATNATLAIINSLPADAGDYTVTVSNPAGAVTTSAATLRVVNPPASNDSFAGRTLVIGSNVNVAAHNLTATKEPNEPNHAGNAGGASVWWTWIAPATGQATIETTGSDFDTLLAVYTGNSLASVSVVAANDDALGQTSRVTFAATAGTSYQIAVAGKNGAVGGITLRLGLSTQFYAFTTVAGGGSPGYADGVGAAVRFNDVRAVTVDAAGNVYVADYINHVIRKVTPAGVATTFAGAAGVTGSSDGLGTAARFNYPAELAIDAAGNIYVADSKNSTIRKITPAGVVTTVAGLAGVTGSTNGTGSAARFFEPLGVTADGAGNLFVADTGNHTIRKIDSAGVVTTLAGTPGGSGTTDGTGSAARFTFPSRLVVNSAGEVFVTCNQTVRKISPLGVVTTLAGVAGTSGTTDGTGAAARFSSPVGLTLDAGGNLIVGDTGGATLRRVSMEGVVTTVAGQANAHDVVDGTGAVARFYIPQGLAADSAGNIYIADYYTVRKMTPAAVVSTLAGRVGRHGAEDGNALEARFNLPAGVALDAAGNIYVADQNNFSVRKISAAGVVSTLAGQSGISGTTDGTGAAARFRQPVAIGADSGGNLYVGDLNVLRKITPAGVVTTLAGRSTASGAVDGDGSVATFNEIRGVAVDGSGNIYVSEIDNRIVRRVTPAGVVTTIAGSPLQAGNADGTGTAARFDRPQGIAVDATGISYVADTVNHRIRKVTAAGVVTTLAGNVDGSTDGTGTAAGFSAPRGVAVDLEGNVFVADSGNHTIRKISPAGVVTTIGGAPLNPGNIDGIGGFARFSGPVGIAVDSAGVLFIAESGNDEICKGVLTTVATSTSIALPPEPQSVLASGTVTFAVVALGSPDPTYQWKKDNVPLAGATGPRLTLTNVQMTDAGNYSVTVTGGEGSVTTAPAALTVQTQAPAITSANAASFAIGKPGSFAVGATGAPTPTFSVASGSFPAWATLNAATGVISGTPNTITGSPFIFTIQASNGVGAPAAQSFTLTVLPPSGDIYFTNFDAFSLGQLGGQDGWITAGAAGGGTGTVDSNLTNTRAAFLGFNPTTQNSVLAGRPLGYDPVSAGARLIRFSVDLKIVDSTNGKRDYFEFFLFNAQGQPLGGIAFSNSDAHALRLDGAATFDLGTFTRGANQALVATIDFVANRWSVTINGVTAFVNAPLTTTGHEVSLGEVDAGWIIGTPGSSGDNYMAFDNYRIAVATPVAPAITTHPVAQTAVVGAPVTLSVVATGVPPPTYQWRKDGVNLSDATNASFTIATPALADAGSYDVVITNFQASVTSQPAALTVITQWANNDLAGASSLTGTHVAVEAGNLGATKESGEPNHAGNAGGHSVWWTWTAPVNGAVLIDTVGSNFDTLLAVYGGTAVNALSLVAQDDNGGPNQTSKLAFKATAGTVYKIAIDGANGATGTIKLNLATYAYTFSTLAGAVGISGTQDGTGTTARFKNPYALSVDAAGNVFVVDSTNQAIRKITPAGVVTTLAGSLGASGSSDGTGAAARFNAPIGLAMDSAGNLAVVEISNSTLRRVTAAGVVTTLAGQAGVVGAADGTGSAARFNLPTAVALDSAGNAYVCDQSNQTIRKVTPAGVVTTLAGSAGSAGSADGAGSAARFNYPTGLAVDAAGNVLVADNANFTLRKITPGGVVTTLAGAVGQAGGTDGPGSAARFSNSFGVATDNNGNIFVTDVDNQAIRLVTPAGVVITVAGAAGIIGSADGLGDVARFNSPACAVADVAGNLYVSDRANQTIRVGTLIHSPTIQTHPQPQAASPGAAVVLNVTATATPAPTYQWTKNGANIAGATGASLTLANVQLADAANYAVDVTNVGGSVTSSAAALTVSGAPTITNHPASVFVEEGHTAIFAVGANAAPVPSYQWMRRPAGTQEFVTLSDGGAYSGATTATLTVTSATGAMSGDEFRCVVGNGILPDALSNVASLTIARPPQFTNTSNAAFVLGQLNSFTFVASGTPAPTFSITGGTLPTWASFNTTGGVLSGTPPDPIGSPFDFVVSASNGFGTAAAQNFTLTVSIPPGPPTISAQPVGTTVVQGGNVGFEVRAYGNPAPQYQWRKNSTAITGATNATLTLSNVQAADAGSYTVVVSNSQGSVTSNAATLNVNTAPVIIAQPVGLAVALGQPASFIVEAAGSPTPAYQWRKAGNAIAGATQASYSIASTTSADAGSYSVVVTNSVTFVTSSPATLTVNVPPTITAQPVAQTVVVGGSVTFSVTATGTPAPTYQWRKNGIDLAGATEAALALTNVQSSDAGSYDVVVTNPAGSLTSAPARLTVPAFLLITNLAGHATGAGFVAAYSIGGATINPSFINGLTDPHGITVDSSGNIWVSSNGSTLYKYSAAGQLILSASLTGRTILNLAADSSGNVYAGSIPTSAAERSAGSGTVAKISADGQVLNASLVTGFDLVTSLSVGSDGKVYVSNGRYNLYANAQNEGSIGAYTSGGAVVNAALIANVRNPQSLSVDGSNNLYVAIDAYPVSGFNINKYSGANGAVITSPLITSLSDPVGILALGSNLYVLDDSLGRVAAYTVGGAVVNASLITGLSGPYGIVAVSALGVSLTTQPQPQTATVGANVTLSVVATGTPAPTYQWMKNGTALAGATNAAVTLTNVQLSDAANYSVVVTNPAGAVTSALAPLTVNGALSITTQPTNVAVEQAQNAIFTVVATGAPAPSYQWQRRPAGTTGFTAIASGAAYGGTTTATLMVNGATLVMTGDEFRCLVSNGVVADVTSDPATLSVGVGPHFTSASSAAFVVGHAGSFTVAASGTPAPTFTVSSGTLPTWATLNPNGTLGGTPPNSAGAPFTFTLAASNGFGTPATQSFTLTVQAPTLPTITAEPVSRSVAVGAQVTFSVAATGTAPLAYQWRKNGDAIANATAAQFTISNVAIADGGNYTVDVSNTVGMVLSQVATLGVIPPGTSATQSVVGAGYVAGGTATISGTFIYTVPATTLAWQVLLPDGWSYLSGGGSEGDVKPATGTTQLLEWAWTNPPASPVAFTVTLNVPAGHTGAKTLTAIATLRQGTVPTQLLAQPDPLSIAQVTTHSADTDRNFRISLLELTRVIELYNTRIGTTRSGAYKVTTGITEDGFEPDSARADTATVTLAKYHSGDSNRDGQFNLVELTRVIELYNYRSGTVRTGQYHEQTTPPTEDGYASGP